MDGCISEVRSIRRINYVHNTKYTVRLSSRERHEYQAVVDPGKDRHDTRLLVGLSLDF